MRTQTGHRYGSRSAAGIACAAVLCLALPARAQVVSYQESRSGGIVYFEEKGGLVTGVASPTKLADGEPAAPASPARAPIPAPSASAKDKAPQPRLEPPLPSKSVAVAARKAP